MKNFLWLLFLTASISCKAQTKPVASSLLWKVEGKELKKPSYLFGTMHLLCDSDLVVTENLRTAFRGTQQLYLELDMDDAGMLVQSLMGMMMKGNITLDQLLPASRYDSVTKAFTQLTGVPTMMIKNMKPLMASSLLYPALLSCSSQGWDMKFAYMAKALNMEVKGLEEVSEQLAVFDSIPYKLQADMFANMLLHADSTRKSFDDLLKLYRKRDIDKLAEMSDDDPAMKPYENVMLYDRNADWIPKIEHAMQTKATFVAVGAAHLGGPKGVIALLRKQGYTIAAVPF